MELARIPIQTSRLSIGMFVGMLDRPWIETPFVFQGFEIKDKFEIEQLQSYCSQVYVDVDRGTLTEAEIRALAASAAAKSDPDKADGDRGLSKKSLFKRVMSLFGLGAFFAARSKQNVGGYEVTATVRHEAPQAKLAYTQSVLQFRQLFERTRRVGAIDIEVVSKVVTPIVDSILRNPDAMAWTVFSGKRSGRNYSRAVATSVWSVMFGRHLGFERNALKNLAIGGLLLDIGNVVLPDDLVNAEGAITHTEYGQVPQHVQAGVDILHRSKGVEPAVFEMVGYHHERYDGSGYPARMRGSDIPVYGRIAGIVDSYDAMTTKTLYSPALAAYDAARELNEMRDTQFQTEVVAQFLNTIGMFPTGSVVELSDGTAGLVLEQNRTSALRPKVMLIKDVNGESFHEPKILDMQAMADADRTGRVAVWIARGHEHGAFGIDPFDYFN